MLRATGSLEKVLSKLLDLALITGACTQYSLCTGSPKTVHTFFVCYQPEFQVQVDNNNLVEMWEELVVERSDEEQVEVSVTWGFTQ